jgi:hypothetical protein
VTVRSPARQQRRAGQWLLGDAQVSVLLGDAQAAVLLGDAQAGVLLLAEFRLQRVQAVLAGFLVLLLLFADRLARRLVGCLGGSLLRLQFGDDLIVIDATPSKGPARPSPRLPGCPLAHMPMNERPQRPA